VATKISMKDLPTDGEYEPGFDTHQGITGTTTGTKYGQMARVQFPPKSESRMHYHEYGDMIVYVISGTTIFRVGKEGKEYEIGPGDFMFIPRGEMHNNRNPSETEPVEGIGAYFGCADPYESGKVLVK